MRREHILLVLADTSLFRYWDGPALATAMFSPTLVAFLAWWQRFHSRAIFEKHALWNQSERSADLYGDHDSARGRRVARILIPAQRAAHTDPMVALREQ
jgi:hypothetical protein